MRAGSANPSRGFALLITVTLLAFLVLLLVSLASLTRVETTVAANAQGISQARQQALMALNIAVGQLQAAAGRDSRVTAQASITSSAAITNPNLTGVWDAATSSADAVTWLVSGSERTGATAASVLAGALDPSDDALTQDSVFLLGDRSVAVNPSAPDAADKKRRIKAEKQNVLAAAGSVPGLASSETPRIGRYAWWVGDQGVKASLALPDRADEVTYAPWSTQTQRRRIRQQIASTPNYFRASNAATAYAKEGFDPILIGSLLGRVSTAEQLGFLTPAAGSLPEFARGRYHDFTTVARSVLANTRTDAHAGLMRDLSLKPDELGAAFAAYANYTSYMETPGGTLASASAAFPSINDGDSSRRRYALAQPVVSSASDPVPGLVFGVSPVITEVVLQFSVNFSSGYQLGTKIYVGLWNPYTSALAVQNDLQVTISGLPQITIVNASGTNSVTVHLQNQLPAGLQESNTGAMRVYLPFTAGSQADRQSWLPGRMYGWMTKNSGDGTINEVLKFYNKNTGSAGRVYYASGALAGGSTGIGVSAPAVSGLTITLKNTSGTLATYTTPAFSAFTIPATATPSTKWFAYAFRLKQPWVADSDRKWLKSYDPHDRTLPATAWSGFNPSVDFTPPLDPSAYNAADPETALPGSLIYRIQGTTTAALSSYNDVPLFELPRQPLLSLGALQHMAVSGKRAYHLGNSWGGADNAVFDRFYFSGLPPVASTDVPNLSAGQPLPNWNLQPAAATSATALQADGALTSKRLLQAGGFNINSTSAAAWRAVLSGIRSADGFIAADIDTSSGNTLGTQKTSTASVTEKFDSDASLGAATVAPAFFRFSQSAQETYFWKPVTSSAADTRQFNTYAFRLGARGSNDSSLSNSPVAASVTAQRLTTDQIEALAEDIVRRIKLRAASKGPFRTLEEFLGPESGAGTPSLLEAAIDTAGLNSDEIKPVDNVTMTAGQYGAGLSSLTLTQADILTALAPYLRARSDTFMIRTYGESLNPVTGDTAGKAWLEATVQRFPETVDAADNIEKPTGAFGRRFKIIAFRWLSSSDI